MGQKDGKKWTAAVHLQPTISKSDSLLAPKIAPKSLKKSQGLMLRSSRTLGALMFLEQI
jgi:hypothetical protein